MFPHAGAAQCIAVSRARMGGYALTGAAQAAPVLPGAAAPRKLGIMSTQYRKDKPSAVVFLNGHEYDLPFTSTNAPGSKIAGKEGRATINFGADFLIDNGRQKLAVNASAAGGFGKYTRTLGKGARGEHKLGSVKVGKVGAAVDWNNSNIRQELNVIREGVKDALPRYDASAFFTGADYDMTFSFSAVVSAVSSGALAADKGAAPAVDMAADKARRAAEVAAEELRLLTLANASAAPVKPLTPVNGAPVKP